MTDPCRSNDVIWSAIFWFPGPTQGSGFYLEIPKLFGTQRSAFVCICLPASFIRTCSRCLCFPRSGSFYSIFFASCCLLCSECFIFCCIPLFANGFGLCLQVKWGICFSKDIINTEMRFHIRAGRKSLLMLQVWFLSSFSSGYQTDLCQL